MAVTDVRGPQPAPAAPPAPRPRKVALTPMRQATAKGLRKLADDAQQAHPELITHQHLRAAARQVEAGNEEAAARHLRAAMHWLTPQAIMRAGILDDAGHVHARQAAQGVHLHIDLIKDIQDADAKNKAAITRLGTGDASSSPLQQPSAITDPNGGYGPGALSQKPTMRQPPGGQAMNAPARNNSGGADKAAADPDGPQPKGSKQFAASWDELAAVIELAEGRDAGGRWSAATRAAASAKAHATASATARSDYSHGWKLRDIGGGKKELYSELPTADKMSRTALKQHLDLHHNGGPDVGGRRTGPRNPSKEQLLATHEAMHADERLSVNPPGSADNSALKGGLSRTSIAHTHGNTTGMANRPAGIGLSAETGRLAVTPAPYGKPGGPGLYDVKGLKHSDYLEQIVKALMRKGMDKGKATAIARGSIRKWMAKSKHPEVKAAAAGAEAEELKAQAQAHAHAVTWDELAAVVELSR